MFEREMWWKLLLCGFLTGLAFNAVHPAEEKIKYGIDLYGGYSLLYEIDDTDLAPEARRDLAERVMKVLQERVDPDGVMNLVWRPVGSNRLEIQMPRPSEAVLKHRHEFDRLKDELKAKNVKRGDVMVALARPAAERSKALDGLIRGVESRRPLLNELSFLTDQMEGARKAKDADKLNDAEEKFDAKLDELLMKNIDPNRLQTILDAGPRTKFRQEELAKVRTAAPELKGLIDELVAAHDSWRTRRGREGVLDDPADLQRLLRGAGVLEWRMLAEHDAADPTRFDTYRENLKRFGPRPRPGEETYRWFEIEKPTDFFKHIEDLEKNFDRRKLNERSIVDRYGDRYFVLAFVTPAKSMTHRPGEAEWALKGSSATRDEIGRPAVSFELDERGGARFDQLTRTNKGKLLCFFLDDKAVSSAEIKDVIRTHGIIHGSFSTTEVQELVKKLNAGSLPRKLKEPPISVRAIGPSLGEANRLAGMRSAIYGAIAVIGFMIVYYFYSGLIAIIAMVINIVMTLAVLAMLGATLTLPGVAGLVLSIGMAVDANILINERIREELNRGVGLRMAVRLGYERAFRAIFDSHLTTLITSIILYWIASEEIKGFGLTLAAGVVINLFTAVFLTRIFFEFMTIPAVPSELIRYPMMSILAPGGLGAVIWVAAYSLTAADNRAQSVWIAFGRMLVIIGGSVFGLYLLMWLTRILHRILHPHGAARLPMLKVIGVPNVDWYGLRRGFYAMSLVLTIGALILFLRRDPKDLYDIEFLGGTSAEVDLKTPGSIDEPGVRKRIEQAADELRQFADRLGKDASVSEAGGEFVIRTPGVPADRVKEFVQALLVDSIAPNGLKSSGSDQITMQAKQGAGVDVNRLKQEMTRVANQVRAWSSDLADAQIQAVGGQESGTHSGESFELVSRVTSKEVVVGAILSKMGDLIDVQPSVSFEFRKNPRMNGAEFFPIKGRDVAAVTGDASLVGDVSDWRGGTCMIVERINPPQSADAMSKRFRAMRLQPGFERLGWRDSGVIGLTPASGAPGTFSRVAVVVSDENFTYDESAESSEGWRANLAEPELRLVREALQRQTSLSKVTQFAAQVAQEAKTKAIIALVLSWLAIILYVWFRFGSAVWGAAAVVALIHDVFVALGFVAISGWLSQTAIGRGLLIEGFRIDLAMVAALLTVVGYSVNDTIIVFDRMRENRGKSEEVRPQLINQSINQTLSRTLLTVLTVLMTIFIMYIFGGRGIHGFMFAMMVGTLTGTYSSVYVASPLLIALQKRLSSPARKKVAVYAG